MSYARDAYRAIWESLVAGSRRPDDMTTQQLADLCRWNDSNGEWSDITESDRATLLEIVTTWIDETRADIR